MFEIYAAAEVPDLAFKSKNLLVEDLEARFSPAIVQELRENFPLLIEYVAAENSKRELADTMRVAFDNDVLKGDFHLVKIKVSIDVEIVSG